MYHGDGVTKKMSVVHKGCIGQGKRELDQCMRVHQRNLELCFDQGKVQREGRQIEAARSNTTVPF